MSLIADKCISDDYVHRCGDACASPCTLNTCRSKLYICYCCHYKMSKSQIPPESSCNNLSVDLIPPQLACLNTLEQHLIALHIPFMKRLALPKGGQNGVHGPVTCVPTNIVETCSLLPRSNMEGSLLPVKLKRKLTYKGHYDYQYVDTMHVQEALCYLKHSNSHYKDVVFNESWINEFSPEENSSVLNNESVKEDEDMSIDEHDDDLLHDRQQHCMFQDTCLMPVDIGQEALDQYVDNVLNVAPSENNNPVKLLSDCTNEAKCFPVLFPLGSNTFHEKRQYRLTLSRYFNNRLLHADGRFARNVEYIFFAQYMSELEQVVSKVSIALRKGTSSTFQNMSEILKNEDSLNKLLQFDDGYRFLKPIRGTPAFWQSAQRDLLACVRMLGKPTWFASFSSADVRWTNLLYSILKQEGRTQTLEQLQWAEKCELLRRNPVTAARMFDFRWHVFVKEVLMSPANPIGKIEDYYYRVEFQQRGSPHCHCLFWISDAPILDKNTDEEVIAFIDKYVTCEIPTEEDPLFEAVTSVQQHSKRHSKSCKKKKTVCRFNFPRPASCRTFICRGEKYQDPVKTCKCNLDKNDDAAHCECLHKDKKSWEQMERDRASEILTTVKNAISAENCPYGTVEEMFEALGISQDLFEAAYKRSSRNTHVVLKRQINEIWINQYSRPLLKAWNANLDIQYCVDAYACCVYIVSYMSKSEREVGLLLGNAQREAAKDGNVSAKEALKTLGSVYLHNRDVSAQEAVYRLTNMHLKECSRKVVFIPTGDNIVKMSLPISVLREKAASQDLTSDDMFMTGIVDRYKNRPTDDVFSDMCLAKFASEYRVLSKNEKCRNSVKLKNGFGIVVKRTRTKPAVVRYARFSETKEPEKFYQSLMQLFMPYRFDVELKPAHCETYGDFYRTGVIGFVDGTKRSVKSVVDLNRSEFELESDHFEAVDNVTGDVMLEDAWAELCPEVELERLECVELQKERPIENNDQENIPDLCCNRKDISAFEKKQISRSEGLTLIRSLNEKQFSVFYQIRQWCLDKVNGKNPEPLHIFVTGGAGTGKSHLIKAIEYESKRLLSTVCKFPDNICVLLTAPTGIAAYNLEATTIHTTFSIGKDVRLPYTPLGEDKINSLRVKYSDLQLLIIDEISMVDHNLLSYVNGRLRQIKQTTNVYGGISVITVGDMNQLSPVKGKPIYSEGVATNIWSELFQIIELTEIVRQKDAVFSQLLNRMRTRSKSTPMLADDIKILKSCETGEVSSALHIFATNKQVSEHNIHQLYKTCPDFVRIGAQDYVNDKKTGKLRLLEGSHVKASNTSLSEVLLLGKGARVMLCKNVDVNDGLANGVVGTVTEIVIPEKDKFPKVVYVKFDDDRVGIKKRKSCHYASSDLGGSTPIEPEEDRATVKGGLRRQFPLKLAWACTVHKVQGMTVDEAVVSFSKIFAPGQAYVAVSRVKSLSGLTIQDFDEKRIYCKDDIAIALQGMTPLLSGSIQLNRFNTSDFTVFLMNVQSLTRHVKDLACFTEHWKPKCVAVTETWLSSTQTDTVKIDGYSFSNRPRHLSYSNRHPQLSALQDQQHGGVGIYCSNDIEFEVLQQPELNLECLVYRFSGYEMVVGVIYRPPLYPLSLFKRNLETLVDWLEKQSDAIALIGDFNDDILKSSTISKFMSDKGYLQMVDEPTTEKGTLIDHVYVKSEMHRVEAVVVPTYFSDHEGVMCGFKLL
uniref:ATP-dependent DNA helicase n=1 Tax=Poecilia mexicana TaxID=48701 RepID=A0A3B3YQH8_9TELE